MEFTERGGLESGFAEVFRQTVRPALERIEAQRVERLGKARKWGGIALAGAAVLAPAVYFGFGMAEGAAIAAIMVGIFALIAVFVIRGLHRAAWHGSVAGAVMPAICDHVGDLSYDRDARAGFPVGEARSLGLFGSYNRTRLSDRLAGRYRDTEFEMVEGHIAKRSRSSDNKESTRTVFRGLLFRIAVPVEAPGRILIARDRGGVLNAMGGWGKGGRGRGMPRVETSHAAFERVFEVHADVPASVAREFLPPLFLENLLAIGEAEGGRKGAGAMTAGFHGRSFFLALTRRGDFLSMGALSKPVTAMEDDLHAIFDDLEIVRRIIDRLHGAGEGTAMR